MKFLIGTDAETNQTVYIPVDRINSIRYPIAPRYKRSLITWSKTDGTIQTEKFEESPSDFNFWEV